MLILIPPNLVPIPSSLPCWKISSHNSHENFIIIEIQDIFMFPRNISQSLKIRAHSIFQVSYLQIPSQQVRHVYRVCWKEYFYLQIFLVERKSANTFLCCSIPTPDFNHSCCFGKENMRWRKSWMSETFLLCVVKEKQASKTKKKE